MITTETEKLYGTLGEKVEAMFPSVEFHGDSLYCVTAVTLTAPLTPEEMAKLKDWWSGQLSDGWGEGFEQREVKVDCGELYIVPWNSSDDFFIETEREFMTRLGLEMPAAQQEASPLSPTQMALDEPGIFDEGIDCVDTSAYMSMLTDRVNANFIEYIDGLRDKYDITDYSAEIATIAEAHYYITNRHNFDKVRSLFPTTEFHDGKLWCVAELTPNEPLTEDEMYELRDWWSGQLSDGWGEGFEQREIKIDRGELYMKPWTSGDDFEVRTRAEFESFLGIKISPTSRLNRQRQQASPREMNYSRRLQKNTAVSRRLKPASGTALTSARYPRMGHEGCFGGGI